MLLAAVAGGLWLDASTQFTSGGPGIFEKDGAKNRTGGAFCAPPAIYFCEVELEGLDVRGLEALGSFGHFEFHSLAIVQRLIAISHDRGKMYEYIFTALALDETEALAGIKPLHCSLFFTHCVTLFCQPIAAEHY